MKNKKISPLVIITILFILLTVLLLATEDRTTTVTDSTLQSTGSILDSGKVNINTASSQTLQLLPGIGEALADRIIAYREEKGPFRSVDALKNVSGIGEKLIASIYDYITVGDQYPR